MGSQGPTSQADPVLAAYERARASAASPAEERQTLARLCIAYTERGQPANAVACLKRALDSGMYHAAAKVGLLNRLGTAYSMLSQYDQAIATYEQALALARTTHDRAGEGWSLMNLGRVSAQLSRYDHAVGYFEQAVPLMRAGHDRRGEGIALDHLGLAHQRLGRYDQAIALHRQALAIAREERVLLSRERRSAEGPILNHLGKA
jgi:tetratricopeptide (TPR) repeat protein